MTRLGTRVIEDLRSLPSLEHEPWTSNYLQGIIDAPFLNLTPGTRSGIIHDERYAALLAALEPLEAALRESIADQRRAEEEQASQQALRAIQKAFQEAMLALPPEEYDWFDVHGRIRLAVVNFPTVATGPGSDHRFSNESAHAQRRGGIPVGRPI